MHHQQLSKQNEVLIFFRNALLLDANWNMTFGSGFIVNNLGIRKTFNVHIALCYCILTNRLLYRNNLFQKGTNHHEKCLLIGEP